MASEKIIVSATDSGGNSVQRTFDNVNPDATNAQLAAFGSKIAAFSENTYAKTDRITRVNCDSEAGGGRQTPTLTVADTNWDYQRNTGNGTNSSAFTYNGDGTLYTTQPVCTSNPNYSGFLCHTYFNTALGKIYADAVPVVPAGSTFSFQLGATETDNFKAPEPITMTLTIS